MGNSMDWFRNVIASIWVNSEMAQESHCKSDHLHIPKLKFSLLIPQLLQKVWGTINETLKGMKRRLRRWVSKRSSLWDARKYLYFNDCWSGLKPEIWWRRGRDEKKLKEEREISVFSFPWWRLVKRFFNSLHIRVNGGICFFLDLDRIK